MNEVAPGGSNVMEKRRIGIAVVVLCLFASVMPLGTAAAARPSKVERGLIQRLDAGELHTFIVEFAGDADLRVASARPGWAARGRSVVRSLSAAAAVAQGPARHLVATTPGASAETFWITNVLAVHGGSGLARRLAALPQVTAVRAPKIERVVEPVERTAITVAADDPPPYGIQTIGADDVWAEGVLGSGVVVANIDTGVDYEHEALAAQYRGNLGGGAYDHDYDWWDPTGVCGDEPCDNAEHGTHTMGTMVGGDGPGPFTPDVGVAPGASWIAAKGCEDFFCTETSLLSAAEFVLAPTDLEGENPDPAMRPDVVNNSWGGGPGNEWYRDMVEAWRAAGIVPVFSAGNPGPECGQGGSPGDYNESFSVGATDEDDVIADFSGRGPSEFGKVNPDVSAPGVDVVSSVPGDGYAEFSGTSMAAPHTAGTIALLMSAEPALLGDVTAVTDAVRSTALDIEDDSCGGDEDGDPNNVYGDGRIDAAAAVALVATGGTLAGTITEDATTDPIAGARIEATAGARTFAATSDDTGHFELFLAAGSYTVTVEAFGYEAGLATGVDILTDQTTTQDFALTALPRRDVTGIVTQEEDGAPLEGAEVRALGTPVAPATTAADGSYTLTLPIGDFTLRTSAGGCTAADETDVTLGLGGLVHDVALARTLDDFGHGCAPIPFEWVDATNASAMFGDQTVGRLPLPFDFPFYGETYAAVFLTDNGFLTFERPTEGWPDPTPSSIPSSIEPNAAIYAAWQNLEIDEESSVTYETVGVAPDRAFVVEFTQLAVGPRFSDGEGTDAGTTAARLDLEVKLWEDGTIDILYGDNPANPGDGRNAGIGIEDAEGTDALSFSLFDDLVSPNTAYRYAVVPNGHAIGTVTDANDGLPVEGATVTATPGGRTAETAADGTYALRLRPGTYMIAISADDYVTAEEAGVVITDGTDTVVDAILDAAVAELQPDGYDLQTAFGTTKQRTLTISNTGTADMPWQLLEREGSRRVPALPPVPNVVRPATWGPFDLPGGVTQARPAALPPEALEEVIDDPDDDSLGSVEVAEVRAGSDNAEMSMVLEMTEGTPMDEIGGYLYFDTDQNEKTGYPPRWFYGLPEQDIGLDYFADLFSVGNDEPTIAIWDIDFELVVEVPATVEGTSVSFSVPLNAFGDDEDGNIDTAGVVGDFFQPLDWIPDEGHGTIRAFTDAPWLAAEPDEGVLAAGEQIEVDVEIGATDLQPGRYRGFFFLLADAPKQQATPIGVKLDVPRPNAWGIASGRVRDAHSGRPIEDARIVVETRWDGDPLTLTARTDDRGAWSIQGPQGEWQARAARVGYLPDRGSVAIDAGRTWDGQSFRLHVDKAHGTIARRPLRFRLLRGEDAQVRLVLGNEEGHRRLSFSTAEIPVPRGGGGGGGGGIAGVASAEPLALPQGVDPNATTTAGLGWSSPDLAVDRAGRVLDSWPTGLGLPWGVGYREPGIVTISDPEALLDAEFKAGGRPLGEFDTPWAAQWPADLTWDPNRELLWQVNVGGDNGIYGLDPSDGSVVDTITGAGWGDTSQRGVAYDPATDTFYVGGWNQGVIHHVAGPSWPDPGDTLGRCRPDERAISGLAWNPAFQMLWMATNTRRDTIWLVDPDTCRIRGGLPHPDRGHNGAGLEMDAEGNLWTVSQGSRRAYLIESGLPTFSDVPWLEVGPEGGMIGPGDARTIHVAVDARDLRAGVHRAMVAVITDDPAMGVVTVPVEILVTKYRRAVNVGGRQITLGDGTVYEADQAYAGRGFGYEDPGGVVTTTHRIAGTRWQGLYQDGRTGPTAYRFTVPDGRYEVTIGLAEIQRGVEEFGRIMDLTAEGRQIEDNLDLAGTIGRYRAHDLTFEVRVRDGVLDLGFRRAFGLPPIVNRIAVTWIARAG